MTFDDMKSYALQHSRPNLVVSGKRIASLILGNMTPPLFHTLFFVHMSLPVSCIRHLGDLSSLSIKFFSYVQRPSQQSYTVPNVT